MGTGVGVEVDAGGGGPGGGGGSSSAEPEPPPPVIANVGEGVGVKVLMVSSVGFSTGSGGSNSPIASTVAATAVSTAPGSSGSPSASAFAVDRASIVASRCSEGVGVLLPTIAPTLEPASMPFSAKAVIGRASNASNTPAATTRFLFRSPANPRGLASITWVAGAGPIASGLASPVCESTDSSKPAAKARFISPTLG